METKSELHFQQIKNDELRKTIKPTPIIPQAIPELSISPQKTIFTDDIIKAMNKYYKLKADYEKKYRKTIKNIKDNDSLSILKKKKLIKAIKPMCIKCKRKVGTIFTNTDRILTAKCGDSVTPCGLDIKIERGSIMTEIKAADYWQNEIENDKFNVIQTKLNFLFGFVNEEDSIIKFDEYKNVISDTLEEYTSTLNYLIQTKETTENIKLTNESLNKNLNLIKENIEKFIETNDIQYIKDAVEINIKNIRPLVTFITNLKYKYYAIQYDEDNDTYTLVKKPYTLESIERVIDQEPKIISYKI